MRIAAAVCPPAMGAHPTPCFQVWRDAPLLQPAIRASDVPLNADLVPEQSALARHFGATLVSRCAAPGRAH